MKKLLLIQYLLPVIFIFVIACLWEFWGEVFSNTLTGTPLELNRERWEYVITAVVMTMLALVGPTLLSIKAEWRRRQSEKNLEASKQRLLRAQEIVHVGDWEIDPRRDELKLSDELYRIFGLIPLTHPLTPESFLNLNAPAAREIWQKIFAAAASPDPSETEHAFLTPSGERHWIRSRRQIIYGDDGRAAKYVGTIQDITNRKQAETSLHEQENFLGLVLDSIQDGISVVDRDLKIVRVNRTLREWFPDLLPLEGRKYSEVFNQLNINCDDCPVTKTLRDGNATRQEIPFRKDSGRPGTLEVFAFPIYDERHQITGAVEFSRDISAHKRDEEEKRQLESQLRQAQKMEAIGTLAGGIAHDFNNILTIILGYLEISLDELPGNSPARPDLDNIFQAANRAKELVHQILSFSRKSKQELRPIIPQSIIKETVKLLRSTISTTIEIQQNIDQDCPIILADPTQLHQVLLNLATNAIHAMDEKGILSIGLNKTMFTKEDLRQNPDLAPGSYVGLSVGDTGCGMAPEIVERIFDPFFTTKEIGRGTGMGLAVVHGIVSSHQGLIKLETTPGQGTVFHIYFPAIETGKAEIPGPAESLPTGHERILVVDDEKMIAALMARILGNLGYRVTYKTGSIETLATFAATPDEFDLVITDQSMPGMSGLELAGKLLVLRPTLPIILCTGFSSKVSEEIAEREGIREIIFKPLEKKKIALAVRQALEYREPESTSG